MTPCISAIIIEAEAVARHHLETLLDGVGQVEVVGASNHYEGGIRLCHDLHPEAVFLDINLHGQDAALLANRLRTLPQPPRLIFTTSNSNRAIDAFRLEAFDYLLKPLDPIQVGETVSRLVAVLRPCQAETPGLNAKLNPVLPGPLLPIKDFRNDKIRLLSRREIVAVLRKGKLTWIHTVLEELSTRYTLATLTQWLDGRPFIQIARHAVVNERAIDRVTHLGDCLYRVHLLDRARTDVATSRRGAIRLASMLNLSC
jgi:DNA-binding LytR/AlgR family response regulator